MPKAIEAVFENGVLRPLEPLALVDREQVMIHVHRRGEVDQDEEEELFDADYAERCAVEADTAITLEEVRHALSSIKGSMDEAIEEDRGEY
jgi:predicted DNA-binding antitoxin AbrB/MazE fold protein